MTHKGVLVGLDKEKLEATFKFTDYSVLKKLETLVDVPIGVTIKKWREERTLAQNNFLWACIGDIARVLVLTCSCNSSFITISSQSSRLPI